MGDNWICRMSRRMALPVEGVDVEGCKWDSCPRAWLPMNDGLMDGERPKLIADTVIEELPKCAANASSSVCVTFMDLSSNDSQITSLPTESLLQSALTLLYPCSDDIILYTICHNRNEGTVGIARTHISSRLMSRNLWST